MIVVLEQPTAEDSAPFHGSAWKRVEAALRRNYYRFGVDMRVESSTIQAMVIGECRRKLWPDLLAKIGRRPGTNDEWLEFDAALYESVARYTAIHKERLPK